MTGMDVDLNRNKEIADNILDHLSNAVLVFDAQLRLQFINAAAEMLLKVSARKVLSCPILELLPAAFEFHADLARALETGHPYTEREVALQVGEQTVTVDCTVTPVSLPTMGKELLVELVGVDRQIRISREEHLIAQHAATRDLVRGLAHEIKNPLGGLRGAAQLLEREFNDANISEYTQVIIQEADRLQKLVDRMLGPKGVPKRQSVNIHEVVEHVFQLLRVEAADSLSLVRDYDPSIPLLWADAELLIQALLNIANNAMHATNGQGSITFKTRTKRQFTIGHHTHRLVASVDVIDDGPGVPAEYVEKIFFPMVSKRSGGTGLGLAIAQSLVSQHGGLIECVSRPGKTVFTLLLPLEQPHEPT